jgi:hypothetical protein
VPFSARRANRARGRELRIVGERSVFCPPRVLLPESPEPFCLFLDELPASQPDVQKAFYSLLLERRLG